MKNFGTATLHANGTELTRVYLKASPKGDYVVLDTRRATFADIRPVGYVEVTHDVGSVGTAESFIGSIIDTARRHLLNAGIIRKYETVGSGTEYEMG